MPRRTSLVKQPVETAQTDSNKAHDSLSTVRRVMEFSRRRAQETENSQATTSPATPSSEENDVISARSTKSSGRTRSKSPAAHIASSTPSKDISNDNDGEIIVGRRNSRRRSISGLATAATPSPAAEVVQIRSRRRKSVIEESSPLAQAETPEPKSASRSVSRAESAKNSNDERGSSRNRSASRSTSLKEKDENNQTSSDRTIPVVPAVSVPPAPSSRRLEFEPSPTPSSTVVKTPSVNRYGETFEKCNLPKEDTRHFWMTPSNANTLKRGISNNRNTGAINSSRDAFETNEQEEEIRPIPERSDSSNRSGLNAISSIRHRRNSVATSTNPDSNKKQTVPSKTSVFIPRIRLEKLQFPKLPSIPLPSAATLRKSALVAALLFSLVGIYFAYVFFGNMLNRISINNVIGNYLREIRGSLECEGAFDDPVDLNKAYITLDALKKMCMDMSQSDLGPNVDEATLASATTKALETWNYVLEGLGKSRDFEFDENRLRIRATADGSAKSLSCIIRHSKEAVIAAISGFFRRVLSFLWNNSFFILAIFFVVAFYVVYKKTKKEREVNEELISLMVSSSLLLIRENPGYPFTPIILWDHVQQAVGSRLSKENKNRLNDLWPVALEKIAVMSSFQQPGTPSIIKTQTFRQPQPFHSQPIH